MDYNYQLAMAMPPEVFAAIIEKAENFLRKGDGKIDFKVNDQGTVFEWEKTQQSLWEVFLEEKSGRVVVDLNHRTHDDKLDLAAIFIEYYLRDNIYNNATKLRNELWKQEKQIIKEYTY